VTADGAWQTREYNVRALVPEYPEYFARWKERGVEARQRMDCFLDLPYGESSAERLDLFPAARENAPLLVFIHGGYWRSLDKSDFSWVAEPYVARGVSVALPNYGLSPAVSMQDLVRQTLGAFAWLYRQAERYGIDRRRILASGHSAGGHLAAMMMAARWPELASDLPPDLIHAGLAVSGLFDLQPLVGADFLQADVPLDSALAQKLSPALMEPATAAPLVTAVGGLESDAFKRQTELIGLSWPQNFRYQAPAPGCHHYSICDLFANPASALFHAALELLDVR
jgi:arylformamidase